MFPSSSHYFQYSSLKYYGALYTLSHCICLPCAPLRLLKWMMLDLKCLRCDTRLAQQTAPKLTTAEIERGPVKWGNRERKMSQSAKLCFTFMSCQHDFTHSFFFWSFLRKKWGGGGGTLLKSNCKVIPLYSLYLCHALATNIREMQICHQYLCTAAFSPAPGHNTQHLITFAISSNSRDPDMEQISAGRRH